MAHSPPMYGSFSLPHALDHFDRLGSSVHLHERTVVHQEVPCVEEIPEECQGPYKRVLEVGVAAKVIGIGSVDMIHDTVVADLNINVAWKGGSEDDIPEVQFYNMAECSELQRGSKVRKGAHGWDFFYRIRCRGTFRQHYDLHKFPFDVQHLRIDVRLKQPARLVQLPWSLSGESVTCDPRCIMQEFILVDATVKHVYMPSYKFGRLSGYDAEAAIMLSVRRKSAYWVINYAVVASIICSLMACAYAIPAINISARLKVALTLVLTMTTMKYVTLKKLPNVSYLTYLDWHILFCGSVLTILTAGIGATHLTGIDEMERFEHKMRPILGGAWIVYHVFVLTFSNDGHVGSLERERSSL